jgi:hypothetical protein
MHIILQFVVGIKLIVYISSWSLLSTEIFYQCLDKSSFLVESLRTRTAPSDKQHISVVPCQIAIGLPSLDLWHTANRRAVSWSEWENLASQALTPRAAISRNTQYPYHLYNGDKSSSDTTVQVIVPPYLVQ